MITDIEIAIEAMLPCQREIIARAALAGCKFEAKETVSTVRFIEDGKYLNRRTAHTSYLASLRDGRVLGYFEDLYSAAVVCMDTIEHGYPSDTKDGDYPHGHDYELFHVPPHLRE